MAPATTTLETLLVSKSFDRFLDAYIPKTIALDSRVLIIEGISGSGKDTLQAYLKRRLTHREVYDYSEGELLQSWNQLQIQGIFELRVKFMKLFVSYIRDVLGREDNAVFLLNRFHLSAYVMTIMQQPKLQRDYEEILKVLRGLPVHIFILRLDKEQIEKRSLHPERSIAWQKFQEQIVKRDGFRDRLERYLWQQKLMLDAAERHDIPYSVIKLPAPTEIAPTRIPVADAQRLYAREAPMNGSNGKLHPRKRPVPQLVD